MADPIRAAFDRLLAETNELYLRLDAELQRGGLDEEDRRRLAIRLRRTVELVELLESATLHCVQRVADAEVGS